MGLLGIIVNPALWDTLGRAWMVVSFRQNIPTRLSRTHRSGLRDCEITHIPHTPQMQTVSGNSNGPTLYQQMNHCCCFLRTVDFISRRCTVTIDGRNQIGDTVEPLLSIIHSMLCPNTILPCNT